MENLENQNVHILNLGVALEPYLPDPVIKSVGTVYAPTQVMAQGDGWLFQMLEDGSGKRLWRRVLSIDEALVKFGGEVVP